MCLPWFLCACVCLSCVAFVCMLFAVVAVLLTFLLFVCSAGVGYLCGGRFVFFAGFLIAILMNFVFSHGFASYGSSSVLISDKS